MLKSLRNSQTKKCRISWITSLAPDLLSTFAFLESSKHRIRFGFLEFSIMYLISWKFLKFDVFVIELIGNAHKFQWAENVLHIQLRTLVLYAGNYLIFLGALWTSCQCFDSTGRTRQSSCDVVQKSFTDDVRIGTFPAWTCRKSMTYLLIYLFFSFFYRDGLHSLCFCKF